MLKGFTAAFVFSSPAEQSKVEIYAARSGIGHASSRFGTSQPRFGSDRYLKRLEWAWSISKMYYVDSCPYCCLKRRRVVSCFHLSFQQSACRKQEAGFRRTRLSKHSALSATCQPDLNNSLVLSQTAGSDVAHCLRSAYYKRISLNL